MSASLHRSLSWAIWLSVASAFSGEHAPAPTTGAAPPEEALTRAQVLERLDERADRLLVEVELKAHVVIRVKTEVRTADTQMGIRRLDYAFFLDHGPVG